MSGFYTAATAMLIQQRRLNTTANNIANVKTSGYKGERTVMQSFNDVLVGRQTKNSITPIGTKSSLTVVDEIKYVFDIGDFEETKRPFDLAIGGEGFFNIQGASGEVYLTRNGAFVLNEQGNLELTGSGILLGESGPIQLSNSNFKVNERGEVYDSEGEYVDKLLITKPEDFKTLDKTVTGLFKETEASVMSESDVYIYQGHLERSNIDLNQELTHMMEVQRSFQSVSNAFRLIDELNGKAISEIGKL